MSEATLTRDNAKARVYVLYTGGTIGMVPTEPGNPLSPLKPAVKDDFQKAVPGLVEGTSEQGIFWDIQGLVDDKGDPVEPLDSSDVNATHWLHMANQIGGVYKDFDGFVVLHGTDTMAYTASGLSFLLQNLAKPVVITGAQLPITNIRTDAVMNLVNAIYIAGYRATDLPLVPEVTICFGDSLLRGNRVRKMSTSSWQGFGSPNFPKLGTIGEHIKINIDMINPAASEDLFVHKRLNTNVLELRIFPGLKASQLEKILALDGIDGVVLETFGAGNAPSYDDFVDVIGKAVEKGKTIVNVTQCPEGMVEMGLYAASSKLQEKGVISGLDMTPEAALAKLMWLLETERGEEVMTQFQIDQRGEQTESYFDVRYGSKGKVSEPVDFVAESARPSGQFSKSQMSRAVLRISGLGVTNTKVGEALDLRAFINLPGADSTTPNSDPHFGAHFTKTYDGPNTVLVADVTTTVRRVIEDGRPIYISLLPEKGKKIWYRGLYLALFTKA